MIRSHSRANNIRFGKKSVAYWATRPAQTLLLFVHGFGSGAVACWSQFPRLLQAERKSLDADFVFFGYDSLFTQTGASAADLFELLDALATRPGDVINPLVGPSEARTTKFQYQRIVIVAHSFGAVIARRALLLAHTSGRSWQPRCALVLFAPAHKGARSPEIVLGLVGLLPAVGGVLAGTASHFVPTMQDLKPGSPMLAELLTDTERELRKGNADHLRARCVVFGRHERVVHTERFAEDPTPLQPWPRKGHMDVQAPTDRYRDPLDQVIEAL